MAKVCFLFVVLGSTDSWGLEEFPYDLQDKTRTVPLCYSPSAPDDDLDDELAYRNLWNILSREPVGENGQEAFITFTQKFVHGRANILDRIAILSGLAQLKKEERVRFCQKILNLPLQDKIPGWIIYQVTKRGSEERCEFLHGLDLWLQKNEETVSFLEVKISEEEKAFKNIQTTLQSFCKA